MKLKSIVTVALLVFVAMSVVYAFAGSLRAKNEGTVENGEVTVSEGAASTPDTGGAEENSERRVIAYYFHGTQRCTTCRMIEQYAREAMAIGFPEALQSGALELRAVNVEDPAHQHFIDEYQLHSRSWILADMDGETQVRWKNLDQIWVLVNDHSAYISYVQEETRAYLEGK